MMKEFRMRGEPIRLGQLLKAADIVSTGGEAKALILDGTVTVNGETVLQRGRKLAEGDIVVCGEDQIRIVR